MKNKILILSCLVFVICKTPEYHSINELPMYGNIQKTSEQIKYDSLFIDEMLKRFPDRVTAANAIAKRGWEFFEKGDRKTAIKRFNQAWLLDSLNQTAIWDFGAYTGSFGNFDQAITFIKKAAILKPNDPNLLAYLAFTYGVKSYLGRKSVNKRDAFISDSIFSFVYSIDSTNVKILNQWLITKYLLHDYSSANNLKKRLRIIDQSSIDTTTIKRILNELGINCEG